MARRRKVVKRPQLKRVFLGCEGDSERSYGAWLQAVAEDYKLPVTVDTYPDTGGGDQPYHIIERCISEMDQREKRYGPYFSRAIILDSDNIDKNPDRNSAAIEQAQGKNVKVILQDFEHESFLLRHIPGHENTRPNKGEGRAALKAAWPEYSRKFGKAQLYDRFGLEDLQRVCIVEPALRDFLRSISFSV